MPVTQLVILLSLGTFQAAVPGVGHTPSPVFEDSALGVKSFMAWLKPLLPPPTFNQLPLQVCVVGAVPFTPEKAPYLPKPLYESQQPLHQLEPYSATFHYVSPTAQSKDTTSRTLSQALHICSVGKK